MPLNQVTRSLYFCFHVGSQVPLTRKCAAARSFWTPSLLSRPRPPGCPSGSLWRSPE